MKGPAPGLLGCGVMGLWGGSFPPWREELKSKVMPLG